MCEWTILCLSVDKYHHNSQQFVSIDCNTHLCMVMLWTNVYVLTDSVIIRHAYLRSSSHAGLRLVGLGLPNKTISTS